MQETASIETSVLRSNKALAEAYKKLPVEVMLQDVKRHGFTERAVSGESLCCWLRSGWSVVLENTAPETIKDVLLDIMGSGFEQEAVRIRDFAERVQSQAPVNGAQPSALLKDGKLRDRTTANGKSLEDLLFEVYLKIDTPIEKERNLMRDELAVLSICKRFGQKAALLSAKTTDAVSYGYKEVKQNGKIYQIDDLRNCTQASKVILLSDKHDPELEKIIPEEEIKGVVETAPDGTRRLVEVSDEENLQNISKKQAELLRYTKSKELPLITLRLMHYERLAPAAK